MPKSSTEWKVHPHEPLLQLADNLWWVRGNVPGMSLKRVMTVLRRADSTLWIHNAIALDAESQTRLERLGEPKLLIVPSALHRLDAPAYKTRYPELRVYGPAGARTRIERVLPLDGTFAELPQDESVRVAPLAGVGDAEAAFITRSADGVSVILNDVVFNMDKPRDALGWLITTLFSSAPGPRVSRLSKWLLVRDRAALRADLQRLAELPGLTRLIVSHDRVASGPAAREALLTALRCL
jgi:hypothetical protein